MQHSVILREQSGNETDFQNDAFKTKTLYANSLISFNIAVIHFSAQRP